MEPAQHLSHADTLVPGGSAWKAYRLAFLTGVIGLVAALVLWLISWAVGQGFTASMRRLGFAYLLGFTFWLTVVLGCLFFVIITHLFRAGWCTTVRRLPEHIAGAMPVLGVLIVPIIVMTLANNGILYPWADAEMSAHHGEEAKSQLHIEGQGEAEQKADAGHWATVGDNAQGLDVEAPALGGKQATLQAQASNELGAGPWFVLDDTKPDSAGFDEEATEAAEAAENSKAAEDQVHPTAVPPKAGHNGKVAGAPSEEVVREQVEWKSPYLNRWFFTLRWIIYLAVWSWIALWFRKQSLLQDHSKDPQLTVKRETLSAPAVLVFAFTISLASVDLVMSLDPVFYSTMWGVYLFAGSFISGICATILSLMALQRRGWLPSVTTEHYHDLGKMLFAFIFFWGYVAFSQYLLIWYGSLPEETYWFQLRGATTLVAAPQFLSGWTAVSLILLFGHLLGPFAFLLSRHVKRNRRLLAMACWWMLIMHLFDLFWLIRPALSSDMVAVNWSDFLMTAATLLGVGGIVVGAAIRLASQSSLVALGDPRLHESMRLDTSAAAPLFEH